MLNQKIKPGEIKAPRLMVGSLDVEALYPSTDVHQASKIVKDRIMKSPLKFKNIDYRWALIYVALTQTPEEQSKSDILELLPTRRSSKGTYPTIKTVHIDQEKERWNYLVPVSLLTSHQKKKIMANVINR